MYGVGTWASVILPLRYGTLTEADILGREVKVQSTEDRRLGDKNVVQGDWQVVLFRRLQMGNWSDVRAVVTVAETYF